MNRTKIEWADYTFNPVTGCHHDCTTSDGKSYCYARAMCRRFAGPWGLDPADPFKPTFHPERLDEPFRLKKPSRIFVGSMCDLFGEWVPKEWIESILMRIRADYNERANLWCEVDGERVKIPDPHTFIFLTKNPGRLKDFDFPPNCWLGVSIEQMGVVAHGHLCDLRSVSERLISLHKEQILRENRLPVTFTSWEPILGPLGGVAHESTFDYDFHHIRWLILGAMSGPGAKKYAPDPRWVSDAVARCRERNIPVFMKNSLRPYWEGELIQEWPEGTA